MNIDWLLKKISLYFGWIASAVLFALLVYAANIEIKDLDLWFHLASGRYILENLSIPNVDVFSATVFGKPWANHEWLFQICVYSIYAFSGIDGLITTRVIIASMTFLILFFLGYNRDKQVIPLTTLFLVVLVYQVRFYIRPDMISLIFFLLYICVLSLHLHSRNSMFILCVVQILWANTHGFFILGPFLVFINISAEWIKRTIRLPYEMNTVGRLSDDEYRRLIKIFCVVLMACFVNPHFVAGALYPFKILYSVGNDAQIFFEHIGELSRSFTLISFFDFGNLLFYKLLILMSAGSFALNYRRIDVGIFIFWIFFLVFSVMAVRNISYFAFVAYFVILANTQHVDLSHLFSAKIDTGRFKLICSIMIKIILVWMMFSYIEARSIRGYYDFDKHVRKSEHGGLSLRNYPYKAVNFLKKNKIKGAFFNDFNSGAYLIGRVSPEIKVYIDGRTELYGSDFFENYVKILRGDTTLFDETADLYHLTGVFLSSIYVPIPKDTIKHLYDSPMWVLVYFDYDASIFLRNIPQNQSWIEKYEIDLSHWEVKEVDLLKIKSRKVTPYRYTHRARALHNLEFNEKAKQEAKQALHISSNDAEAHKVMGVIALEEKKYMQALEWIRNAKIFNPADIETRYYLSKAYYHLGEYKTAGEQLNRVIKANPENHLALYLLFRIYDKLGREKESKSTLELIKKLVPDGIEKLEAEFD